MIHSAVAIDSDFRPTTLALAAAGMSANSLGPDYTPPSYKAALSCPEASLWLEAIDREKASMSKFAVFEEVPVPAHRQPITARWVFKIKCNPDGSVSKYKARLVARDFRQKAGIDYFESFAPVTRYETVRALLAFAAQHGLSVHQLDVCTAFLHGHLPEEVCLHFPPGYKGKPGHCFRLRKSIYGLVQSPRCFAQTLHKALLNMGFSQSKADPCLFHIRRGTSQLSIASFVDDILMATNDDKLLSWFKSTLSKSFKCDDLGPLRHYLGMEITQHPTTGAIHISQRKYILDVLARFGLTDANTCDTPMDSQASLSKKDSPITDSDRRKMARFPHRQLVGSLLCASISTRPDTSHAVSRLSRHLTNPGLPHWKAAKRVLRYLKGTADLGITYSRQPKPSLHGFSDSACADCLDTRRSTCGFVFKCAGGPVSWLSRRQPVVSVSTAEAEYYAAFYAAQEALWLHRLLSEFNTSPLPLPTFIGEDNQATITLSKDPALHNRSKHVDTKHHWLRDTVLAGRVRLHYVPTSLMTADILTKPLKRINFESLRTRLLGSFGT